MSRYRVQTRIRRLRPLGFDRSNAALYDLADAAACLIEPKVDAAKLLRDLKPEQLPDRLRETYWNAKFKQLRYEEKAGDLWRSEKVIALLSEVLQDIRTKLQLLPDSLDRAIGLSNEHLTTVTSIVDTIQDDIHKQIVEVAASGRTVNRLLEEEEEAEGDRDQDDLSPVDDYEDIL
ncbi:phage terminase Nu1 subunit (DNA packaging protein) [Amorphus orientalis]|uniref:Phage terminase Nu1 subunit (DNA packaging protein) n=2 Tax=Amorphus orientalis TaxID=649198 RepID=A0AAE4AUZ9_9HYPH|nr:phage terminase Nu1 subunit (DNA packaging protein) [Amorphus orientalis]